MKMDEDSIFNKLIVMDDVLGLADKSANFTNFLTVMRKFNFTCVYAFHTIYLTRSNWQMILSQTKNVTFLLANDSFTNKKCNIFPGSLQT